MLKKILLPVFVVFALWGSALGVVHGQSSYKTAEITATSLTVRSQASQDSAAISKLSKGQEVVVVDTEGEWLKIRLGNGKSTGWISSQYASFKDSYESGTVNGNNVNVRKSPSLESPVSFNVNSGDSVKIIEKNGDWFKVEYGSQTGYIYSSLLNAKESEPQVSRGALRAIKLVEVGQSKLGSKYVYGAMGSESFDCSGFTSYVYKNALNINLPHSSKSQSEMGTRVAKSDLIMGDLVFFDTVRDGSVGHVGIYISDGKFIHASSGKGEVVVSELDDGYYSEKYLWATRILE